MIETIRPGAPLYPFPEVGEPVEATTIDPDFVRYQAPLYALPTTDGPVDNTIGVIIITTQPSGIGS
jgi:hypothetical protein